MLKPKILVDSIRAILTSLVSIEILFISRHTKKGEFVYESHYPALGKGLNKQLEEAIIVPLIESMVEMDLSYYDPVSSLDSCMQYIEVEKVRESQKIIENIDSLHSSTDFSIKNIDSGNLIGYCIKITGEDKVPIYMFKKLTNSKLLEKKKFLCFYMGATLEKIENQPLTIDERIDCLIYKDSIYILNTYFFEVFFKVNDEYKRKVDGILKEIEKNNIIANIESFAVECKNSKLAQRRLIKIASTEYMALRMLANDLDKMNSLIEEHNLLLDVSSDGKIIYNEGDSVEPILRLIDGGLITMDVYGTKGHALRLSPPLEN